MDAAPRGDDACRGSVEVLILQLSLTATIDRESEVSSEGLYIKVIDTLADLLIRSEADADTSMR